MRTELWKILLILQLTEPSCRQRAVDAGLLRPADGQTSTRGDQHRQPDRRRLSDEDQRIADEQGTVPGSLVEHLPVESEVAEQRDERQIQEEGYQEETVGDRERSEEETGDR